MKIAIIGAAGYVGMELTRLLEERGHEVLAVARNNGKFLLKRFRCKVVHPRDVGSEGSMDAVINLAYPTSGSVHFYSVRNREILNVISRLSGPQTQVIHTSTLAVFGFQLEYPTVPQPVRNRRDYLYVESKIELENLLQKRFHPERLAIVRLGNVWGPGSAAWTAALADRLLFGAPVGVENVSGISNVTDVGNVASYLTYLAETVEPRPLFHHLAEMGSVPWSFWINKIADKLAVEPVYAAIAPPYPASMRQELSELFAPLSPNALYKRMVFGRFTGSLLHSVIRIMREQTFEKIKRSKRPAQFNASNVTNGDEVFMWVMSCTRPFPSIVATRWQAPVDVDESWHRIDRWMTESGYVDGMPQK